MRTPRRSPRTSVSSCVGEEDCARGAPASHHGLEPGSSADHCAARLLQTRTRRPFQTRRTCPVQAACGRGPGSSRTSASSTSAESGAAIPQMRRRAAFHSEDWPPSLPEGVRPKVIITRHVLSLSTSALGSWWHVSSHGAGVVEAAASASVVALQRLQLRAHLREMPVVPPMARATKRRREP